MAPRPSFPDTSGQQGPQFFHVRNFQGANVNVPRESVANEQFAWLENYLPVAPGNLRALPAEASTLYTAPGGKTIVNAYFYNIGAVAFGIMFLSDGTAQQVNTTSGAVTNVVTTPGTLYNGSYLPVAAQWNAQGIIILAELGAGSPNNYYAWDGTTLTGPGGAAPNWLTNSTPTTMPSGVHGNAIEVYQNRVWITTPFTQAGTLIPSTITVSAPSNGADFATADGSSTTPQQDSSLRYLFNAMRQSNGFLYLLGDSNATAISNVQTSGSPPVTTYSNQNLDPQVGTAWQNSAQLFGQAMLFANVQGVFLLYGGIIQKVSHDLDALFAKADFSLVPSGAVAVIFGVKVYMLLIRSTDFNNVVRSFLCMWNEKSWFFGSTVNTGTSAVYSQEVNSNLFAWGTDGTHLYKMFQTASTSLTKTFQSKLFCGDLVTQDDGWTSFKKLYRYYFTVQDYSGQGVTLTGTMDSESSKLSTSVSTTAGFYEFTNSSNQIIHFVNSTSSIILWGITTTGITGMDVSTYGRLLGVTQQATAADYSLAAFALEYSWDVAFLG